MHQAIHYIDILLALPDSSSGTVHPDPLFRNGLRYALSIRKSMDLEHLHRPTKSLQNYETALKAMDTHAALVQQDDQAEMQTRMLSRMTSQRVAMERSIKKLSKPPRRSVVCLLGDPFFYLYFFDTRSLFFFKDGNNRRSRCL